MKDTTTNGLAVDVKEPVAPATSPKTVRKAAEYPADAQVLDGGKYRFACIRDTFKPKSGAEIEQARLVAVKPRLDKKNIVIGWDRDFDGPQLTMEPDLMLDFLSEARGIFASLKTKRNA